VESDQSDSTSLGEETDEEEDGGAGVGGGKARRGGGGRDKMWRASGISAEEVVDHKPPHRPRGVRAATMHRGVSMGTLRGGVSAARWARETPSRATSRK
jgi:hypothetical protein